MSASVGVAILLIGFTAVTVSIAVTGPATRGSKDAIEAEAASQLRREAAPDELDSIRICEAFDLAEYGERGLVGLVDFRHVEDDVLGALRARQLRQLGDVLLEAAIQRRTGAEKDIPAQSAAQRATTLICYITLHVVTALLCMCVRCLRCTR